MRISIADRQISSRFAAYRLRRGRKYRFTYCPLIHRRRDGGPPLLGGAAPFSSRQRRATFPAIGKVYPTKIAPLVAIGRRSVECVGLPQQASWKLKMENWKLRIYIIIFFVLNFQLSPLNFQLVLAFLRRRVRRIAATRKLIIESWKLKIIDNLSVRYSCKPF